MNGAILRQKNKPFFPPIKGRGFRLPEARLLQQTDGAFGIDKSLYDVIVQYLVGI
jgi:hypothetical protein